MKRAILILVCLLVLNTLLVAGFFGAIWALFAGPGQDIGGTACHVLHTAAGTIDYCYFPGH
jgi:hypothetical protein